jgi:hypothetical protein
MIFIHYVIGQISPNLLKVDATTLQKATYRSSMMLNEVSSLWFIENLQIPFKLILSTFFYILTFFFKHWYVKFLQYQWGWILNDVQQHVIKCWSYFCYKKEAFPIFLVIPKTGQTIESMRVVNIEIHLLPNRNFFLLQVFLQL